MAKKNIGRDVLLGMMKAEQLNSGCVSEEFMVRTAKNLGISVSEVYGVATFYSFISTTPLGKHVIRVCKSLPCCMQEAELVIDWIAAELEINPGETTADGRFSFELTNCIGTCDVAPSMLIDDKVFGNLTREKIIEILKSFD